MTETLHGAISKASTTQKALISVTAEGGKFDRRELVRLRSQFRLEMLEISRLSREDVGLRSDETRYFEFREKQKAVESDLSNHQAKWLMHEIERDRKGYDSATQSLRKSQEEFFSWAVRAV